MPEKHIPERTCVGCRRKRPQAELLRFAYRPPDTLRFDPRKKLPGRGAYLCPDERCLHLALRRRALNQAYRTALPAGVYREFENLVKAHLQNERKNL